MIKEAEYKQIEQHFTPKRPILMNCLKAFLVGGVFSIVGQAVALYVLFPFY